MLSCAGWIFIRKLDYTIKRGRRREEVGKEGEKKMEEKEELRRTEGEGKKKERGKNEGEYCHSVKVAK